MCFQQFFSQKIWISEISYDVMRFKQSAPLLEREGPHEVTPSGGLMPTAPRKARLSLIDVSPRRARLRARARAFD